MYRDEHIHHIQEVAINYPPVPCCKLEVQSQTVSPPSESNAEDEEEEIVKIENVTVKFRISESEMVAQVYPNRLTIGDLKKDMGRRFEIKEELLTITENERELDDDCLLYKTCTNEFGIHEFELKLVQRQYKKKEKPPKLDLNVYYSKYQLPDFITVHIPGEDTEDGQPKNIIVEIEDKAIKKPFICGFRDPATGREYVEAFTQTGPYFDKIKFQRYVSRDTQTFEHREKTIDTAHEQSTQCWLDGNNVIFVSSATDFEIVPKKYQTYAQQMRLENKLEKIKLIQRNWRRFLVWRFIKNCAREYRRLVANRLKEEEKSRKASTTHIAREARARQFPHTKEDFDLLYTEIQKWKIAEMKRISSMYEGAPRIVEINMLLDKEIQLLKGIEKQKALVLEALEEFRKEQMLTELGTPIKWFGYKDNVIHLDLIRNQRARFLKAIYDDLKQPLEKEARIELLGKCQQIVLSEQEFPGFADLLDLFDREKNLLIYTQYCDVEILRKRQNILFEALIQFTKEKPKPEEVGRQMCIVCKKVKPYEQFAVETRNRKTDTCSHCYYMKVPCKDNITYSAILRGIQRDERRKRCKGSFAFVMQVDDIKHIINVIWHGHSIISKTNDIHDLRLPRWIKGDDWSPWNCVLLTQEEARCHYGLSDPNTFYDKNIVSDVLAKHMLGRVSFHKLAVAATEFVETGQWDKCGINKERSYKLEYIKPESTTNPYKDKKSQKCRKKPCQIKADIPKFKF